MSTEVLINTLEALARKAQPLYLLMDKHALVEQEELTLEIALILKDLSIYTETLFFKTFDSFCKKIEIYKMVKAVNKLEALSADICKLIRYCESMELITEQNKHSHGQIKDDVQNILNDYRSKLSKQLLLSQRLLIERSKGYQLNFLAHMLSVIFTIKQCIEIQGYNLNNFTLTDEVVEKEIDFLDLPDAFRLWKTINKECSQILLSEIQQIGKNKKVLDPIVVTLSIEFRYQTVIVIAVLKNFFEKFKLSDQKPLSLNLSDYITQSQNFDVSDDVQGEVACTLIRNISASFNSFIKEISSLLDHNIFWYSLLENTECRSTYTCAITYCNQFVFSILNCFIQPIVDCIVSYANRVTKHNSFHDPEYIHSLIMRTINFDNDSVELDDIVEKKLQLITDQEILFNEISVFAESVLKVKTTIDNLFKTELGSYEASCGCGSLNLKNILTTLNISYVADFQHIEHQLNIITNIASLSKKTVLDSYLQLVLVKELQDYTISQKNELIERKNPLLFESFFYTVEDWLLSDNNTANYSVKLAPEAIKSVQMSIFNTIVFIIQQFIQDSSNFLNILKQRSLGDPVANIEFYYLNFCTLAKEANTKLTLDFGKDLNLLFFPTMLILNLKQLYLYSVNQSYSNKAFDSFNSDFSSICNQIESYLFNLLNDLMISLTSSCKLWDLFNHNDKILSSFDNRLDMDSYQDFFFAYIVTSVTLIINTIQSSKQFSQYECVNLGQTFSAIDKLYDNATDAFSKRLYDLALKKLNTLEYLLNLLTCVNVKAYAESQIGISLDLTVSELTDFVKLRSKSLTDEDLASVMLANCTKQ